MTTTTPVADLAAARTAIETITATSITPTTTLGSSTYTWTEMLDLIQRLYKESNGGSEDYAFHVDLTAFYTALEAELAL